MLSRRLPPTARVVVVVVVNRHVSMGGAVVPWACGLLSLPCRGAIRAAVLFCVLVFSLLFSLVFK